MLVRIFTLKFHTATEQFDDETLQEFIKDKEVLSIREHFFMNRETPYLVLVVTYLPGADISARFEKTKETWRESLTNEQIPVFDALRDWRAERAKQDGVPLYIILKNQQLAQIVLDRPTSLAGLGKIQGIGKAKLEKYGKEILAVLSTKQEPTQKSEHTSHDQQQTMFEEEPRKI
jgi:superfamily II DNA helicase RecQ